MNSAPIWIRTLGLALLLLALAACAKPRTVLVLMPNPDGSVGAVEVSNSAGSQVVESAGQVIRVKTADQAPSAPEDIAAEEIETLFGSALKVLPQLPEQFVLYFIVGTSELTCESKRQLPEIVKAIKRYATPEVVVVGHTDRSGPEKANYLLALERATMVRERLVAAGLQANLVEAESHGENNPLIATPDEVAEPRNRRVEVFVR
jgi:outer membrane protein OmpA-like peptidoglycan-associated protein